MKISIEILRKTSLNICPEKWPSLIQFLEVICMKDEMSSHLCGVLPGPCVLCYEVHAYTGSMHCDRTATGKHGFLQFFRRIISPVIKGWSVPTTGQPWGRVALNLKKTLSAGCLKSEDEVCTFDILRKEIHFYR